MKTDCHLLKGSSLYVRNWIDKQPSVKEESLTDWLLFDISSKIPRITYKAFTRHEEARKTGADWEWWFLYNNFSYKFRVQAKKLKPNVDNYASLAYTNAYGLQIEKLISDVTLHNFLPLYAFYTNNISNTKCGLNIIDEGVYIGEAQELYEKFIVPVRHVISDNTILSETIPLSCLLCCEMIRYDNNGTTFLNFLSRYFEKISVDGEKSTKLGQYTEIPNYVISIIKSANEKNNSWVEKEFDNFFKDVNGILIFDNRDIDKNIFDE